MSTDAIDPPGRRPAEDHLVHEVVGAPLTAVEAGAAIALGVVARLLVGSMSVLLGALASEHRLTVAQIGVTAMGEALTMGLAAAGFGALVKPVRLRLIGLVAIIALAAINLAMVWASGVEVIGLRALAGAAEGVLLWIAIGMIARSETPERWAGVFYASMTACQFVLTGALTAVVTPHWRGNGGFILAAVLVLAAAPIALFGRDRYAPLPGGAAAAGSPPLRGWVALAASLLFAAAFGAVAIYTVPLARQAGLSAEIAGIGITAALATQILGGALATALAGRAHYFAVFVICTLATIAGWVVFMFWPPAWLFIIASMAVGFVYMVATPFLVPMLIEADPSRRAAVQSGGAQLFGAALGPFLASRVVGEHNVHGAVVLAAVLLLAGLSILGALHLTTTRTD